MITERDEGGGQLTVRVRPLDPGANAGRWRESLSSRGGALLAETTMAEYKIDGNKFSTLEEFYDEISRLLIPGAEWGRNLDAFNDILRGGFGTPDGGFTLRWLNHDVSRDRDGSTLTLEVDHRAHAQVELVIRDLKDGPLAHLPSGVFTANAAWLVLAALAHNLGRATLAAASRAWSTATVAMRRDQSYQHPTDALTCLRDWNDSRCRPLSASR